MIETKKKTRKYELCTKEQQPSKNSREPDVRISASIKIGCIVRYIWCIRQLWATKGTVRATGTENGVENKAQNAKRNQDIRCGGATEKSGWREAREHQISDHWIVHDDIGLSAIYTEMTRTSSNTGQCQRLKQWWDSWCCGLHLFQKRIKQIPQLLYDDTEHISAGIFREVVCQSEWKI